jgi:hypothetical protein
VPQGLWAELDAHEPALLRMVRSEPTPFEQRQKREG